MTVPQRRQFTRRMAYSRKTKKAPQGNELEAPLGELIVARSRALSQNMQDSTRSISCCPAHCAVEVSYPLRSG